MSVPENGIWSLRQLVFLEILPLRIEMSFDHAFPT